MKFKALFLMTFLLLMTVFTRGQNAASKADTAPRRTAGSRRGAETGLFKCITTPLQINRRRARCGKVILAAAEAIHYYDRVGGEVRSVAWR